MPEAFPSDPVQYIFRIVESDSKEYPCVNAVSESYINRGMTYGSEVYRLEQGDLENAEKLGRYGSGTLKDGNERYVSKERKQVID